MNRDDVIRWAREAGMRVGTNLSGVVLVGSPAEIGLAHLTIEELERCAALVAAAAKAEEREACAKVLDEMAAQDKRSNYYQVAAKTIRARGQQ